ncbi:MAG TPA: hypothetical protein VHS06_12415 [Chloroflexota bacterium]|nr:hypothetical protein [Chloroflexota bacterium]
MTPIVVEVGCKTAGVAVGVHDIGPVALQLMEERLTVAELIRRTVEEQVRELLVRRKLAADQARQLLDRQYLTEKEIARQAEHGAVRYPSGRVRQEPPIDPAAEVWKALRGFENGSYLILIDGRRMERLEETIDFAPGVQVTFLRVMPLMGG